MVLVGEYELTLVGRDGVPLPEVTHVNGVTYAVASPGVEFTVRFAVQPFAVRMVGGMARQVSIYVDGVSIGYTKLFARVPQSGLFEGFLESGDMHSCTYRAFKMTQPVESDDKQLPPTLDFTEGLIVAKVHLALPTGQMGDTRQVVGPAALNATNESVARMPEGKKFFMAPSLTTGAGRAMHSAGFNPQAYAPIGHSVAKVELRYETPSTLLLRGVLRPGVPAHDRILARFPETAALKAEHQQQRRQRQREGGAGPSHAAAAAAESGVAPQQQRRKRQRAEAEGEAEIVDLTGAAPRPDDEILAAKRSGKVLECDLTAEDDDEGAPRWRAVDERAHAVE